MVADAVFVRISHLAFKIVVGNATGEPRRTGRMHMQGDVAAGFGVGGGAVVLFYRAGDRLVAVGKDIKPRGAVFPPDRPTFKRAVFAIFVVKKHVDAKQRRRAVGDDAVDQPGVDAGGVFVRAVAAQLPGKCGVVAFVQGAERAHAAVPFAPADFASVVYLDAADEA